MAQLVGLIVSGDEAFTTQIGRLLRSGAIPVGIVDDRLARDNVALDLVIVDTRGDPSSAMSTIERMRAASPNAGIFVVALQADPDLILQSMRAGANEFFTWPPPEETFHGAIRRTAARRETTQGAKPPATTLVFFGAKGGPGRSRPVSRHSPEVQPARRARQPAPARQGVPQGTGRQAQIRPRHPGRV
jgi:pilus assembly protein CpaE